MAYPPDLQLLDKVKDLLGIQRSDTTQDGQLNFILDLVAEQICNYCHIETVPIGLTYTAVMMCVDTYKQANLGTALLEAETKSITRGDTSYSYRTASEIAADKVKNPSFVNNYTIHLNRYRKVGFR